MTLIIPIPMTQPTTTRPAQLAESGEGEARSGRGRLQGKSPVRMPAPLTNQLATSVLFTEFSKGGSLQKALCELVDIQSNTLQQEPME